MTVVVLFLQLLYPTLACYTSESWRTISNSTFYSNWWTSLRIQHDFTANEAAEQAHRTIGIIAQHQTQLSLLVSSCFAEESCHIHVPGAWRRYAHEAGDSANPPKPKAVRRLDRVRSRQQESSAIPLLISFSQAQKHAAASPIVFFVVSGSLKQPGSL